MPRQVFHIAISGGIGVGKTTLVERLGDRLSDCFALLEYPEQNRYLADFYSDKQRWAFHSRIGMLALYANRYRALAEKPPSTTIVLMDRCVHETITFATLQYMSGYLSNREFSTYRELHAGLSALAPTPDIVIYVRCSPEISVARVRARGRCFEMGITEQYVAAVEEQYERWLEQLPAHMRVLRLDTSESFDLDALTKTIESIVGASGS